MGERSAQGGWVPWGEDEAMHVKDERQQVVEEPKEHIGKNYGYTRM